MPLNFPRNTGASSVGEFPFELSSHALGFTIPIKANEDSFKKLVNHSSRLRLERGIVSQDELSDTHFQISRAITVFGQSGISLTPEMARNQVWQYHQIEMARLFVDCSYLILTEGFFKFNPVTYDLDVVGGDINKIKVEKEYWEKLKSPTFGEKDEYSDLYPDLEKIIDFPTKRKNLDKKPLEVMIAIIHYLKTKELENLNLTKEHLSNALSNSEITPAEYSEIIHATENSNFSFLLDKYVGIFVQEFSNRRVSPSGSSFRR